MKLSAFRSFALVLLLTLVASSYAADIAVGQTIAELQLKDGRHLNNLVILSVKADYVMAKWDGGRGSIAVKVLPDAVRAELGISPPEPPIRKDEQAFANFDASSATIFPETKPDSASKPPAHEQLPTEVELTNGFVMHGCKVMRWHLDGIDVSFVAGNAPIKFANIVTSQREIFLRHRDAGLRLQRRLDAELAARSRIQNQWEENQKAQARQQQQRIEATNEAIHDALADHRVVVGMSEDQVREAVGSPTRTTNVENTKIIAWLYDNRPRFENGVNVPWQVFLSDGVVVGQTK